ncbi:MAG TPA: iron-sulfur cluster assembly scaffold protein [Woeseiaceae bacterium]
MSDPYAAEVRRHFANPAHAGDLPPRYAVAAVADASDGRGFSVRLAAAAERGVVQKLAFRAFGCPHLIAAAEAACQECEGRPPAALASFAVPALLERLAVPVEKTGRILLLEDALQALAKRLAGTNPDRT